jgi:hypothetical protein
MTTVAQRSFAAGEIAPALYARPDQVKYATGLRKCVNGFIMRHGGWANRPGTEFVGEVKNSAKAVRLIPFVFNSDQTYVLEFGDLSMRVIRDGAYVTDLTLTITAVSNANPGVVTYTGTDPVAGEEVYISGIVGAIGTYLNGRNFKVGTVDAGANTFQLKYMDGSNVNTTAMGAYTSGGTAVRIYTITTPYVEADLPTLRFVQSADVVTITHGTYAPRELTRTGHSAWTLALITFAPSQAGPTNVTFSSLTAGAVMQRYRVTAINSETGEESLVGAHQAKTITGATQANPCQITANGHGYATGDEVTIDGVVGMVELNSGTYIVTNTGANTFTLDGINSTAYTAYTSGGNARRTGAVAAAATSADPHVISWTAAADASEYNVYKELNGIYGYIGTAGGTTFSDIGTAPDVSDSPPTARNPFSAAGDYPLAVTYSQQRLFMGGSDNDPERVHGSRTAYFKNFTVSQPGQDDDAVDFVLAGNQVNAVKHLLELRKLLVFTSGGEIVIQGDVDGVIRPDAVNPSQHTYSGSSELRPLVVGSSAVFAQARGSIVRDLAFESEGEGYRGNDLSIFSAHLFDGYTLSDWAYQQIPHSIIWCVRSDGVLLGMTYVREHQIVAWHRHEFDGVVENVCSVPEGDEDALYLTVKRTINSAVKRYVERMATRQVDDIVDCVYMDCALSYDGRNTGATTMTLSGAGWTYEDTLTLTASAPYFAASDVGNRIDLVSATGEVIRCTITVFTSTTEVSVRPHKTVPANLQATARTAWSKCVKTLSGLWHIEGEAVSILADGHVAGSPNNASYASYTVTNGAITLASAAAVIHVGLPVVADLETLDIETAQGEPMSDKKKLISKVTVYVEESRGLWAGPLPPEEDATNEDDSKVYRLDELRVRGANGETYDDPVALITGSAEVKIGNAWNPHGRVFLRQIDPLPLTVLAVMPAGYIPIRG